MRLQRMENPLLKVCWPCIKFFTKYVGITTTQLVNGEGSFKVKFVDTSYHHGKKHFMLRVSIYMPVENSYTVIFSKLSSPFKVYSKKKRTFTSAKSNYVPFQNILTIYRSNQRTSIKLYSNG